MHRTQADRGGELPLRLLRILLPQQSARTADQRCDMDALVLRNCHGAAEGAERSCIMLGITDVEADLPQKHPFAAVLRLALLDQRHAAQSVLVPPAQRGQGQFSFPIEQRMRQLHLGKPPAALEHQAQRRREEQSHRERRS